MIELTKKQIRRIVCMMEGGEFHCYYNKETKEITVSLFSAEISATMGDILNHEMKNIRKYPEKYIKILSHDVRVYIKIMNSFIDTVEDADFQKRLANSLVGDDPYYNFATELKYSSFYWNEWVIFRKQEMARWIEEQIRIMNKEGGIGKW
jgi:hypothetical protein